MELMQTENLGYLAVSLGFYKTLFSCSGSSTSSEIPEEERKEMGLSDGLIRFSIGLTTILKELTKNERLYGKNRNLSITFCLLYEKFVRKER
jgi:methionine-gamma-lyase